MRYTLRFPNGYVTGRVFELAATHKQVVTDLLVATDDGGCFLHINAYMETESEALANYFFRKIGAEKLKGENCYEVS